MSGILQVVAILRGSSCVACTEHIGEDNMSDVVIKSHSDGPYHVKGHFKIVTDGDREIAFDRNEAWLRRWPASRTTWTRSRNRHVNREEPFLYVIALRH